MRFVFWFGLRFYGSPLKYLRTSIQEDVGTFQQTFDKIHTVVCVIWLNPLEFGIVIHKPNSTWKFWHKNRSCQFFEVSFHSFPAGPRTRGNPLRWGATSTGAMSMQTTSTLKKMNRIPSAIHRGAGPIRAVFYRLLSYRILQTFLQCFSEPGWEMLGASCGTQLQPCHAVGSHQVHVVVMSKKGNASDDLREKLGGFRHDRRL